MRLSKNFTLKELIKSHTATRRGISNEPTQQHLQNLQKLVDNILQPIRDGLNMSITLNSCYRSKALNKAVGGSLNSQHCKGEAGDIDVGDDNFKVFNYIKDNLDFDQMIWEAGDKNNPAWVHVSYREGRNRKQVLRMVNGKYFNYE